MAGRDHRLGLDRLLVELGPLLAAAIEAVAADRAEMAARRTLQVGQPAQRSQADLHGPGVARPAAAEDQGVRQLGVVVG